MSGLRIWIRNWGGIAVTSKKQSSSDRIKQPIDRFVTMSRLEIRWRREVYLDKMRTILQTDAYIASTIFSFFPDITSCLWQPWCETVHIWRRRSYKRTPMKFHVEFNGTQTHGRLYCRSDCYTLLPYFLTVWPVRLAELYIRVLRAVCFLTDAYRTLLQQF